MKKHLVLAAFLTTAASAHTAVTSISPAAFASVSAPKAVELSFSEPVDLHFCTFKVYPLKSVGNQAALNRAAADLSKSALSAKNDEAERADLAPKLSGMAAKLTLPLKPKLPHGAYAVFWRLLSEDGHVVSGQSVFNVK